MVDEVLQGFLGLETVVSVFQIDVVGLQFVPVADRSPKGFVCGGLIGGEVADATDLFGEGFVGWQAGCGDAEEGEGFEEGAFVHGFGEVLAKVLICPEIMLFKGDGQDVRFIANRYSFSLTFIAY